ncbi:MAG: tetratricopeptide repeat protein [Desulfobulbaceae bacterium]|nr:tetratricopeptide repeat protein [Desulfobulbaceae bacterium]
MAAEQHECQVIAVSLLFDALNRLQANDGATGQQGGLRSSQPLEPTGDLPPTVNSAVFLQIPEGVARGRPLFFPSTLRKPKRALLPILGGVALLLLVGGGGAWFYLHDHVPFVTPQNPKVEPPGATGAALVSPPRQSSVSQNPTLPVDVKEVSSPLQAEQGPIAPLNAPSHSASSTVVADVVPGEQVSESERKIPFVAPLGTRESSAQEKEKNAVVLEQALEQRATAAEEVVAKTPRKLPTSPKKGIKGRGLSPEKVSLKTRPARQPSLRPKTSQARRASQASRQDNDNASHDPPVHIRLNPSADSLQEGYDALSEGRLEDAERKYLEVIANRPHEKDALLGLAVVAHRNMQTERASDLYQQVLREDPSNATATAALVNLSAQVDPVAAESRLKQLISQKQTSSELHHALGRVLARQKRWGEAQQSFFRAYSLAPNNAIYVYNLAVALDRLRQPAAALSYYEKLAQLIKPGDAVISRETLQRRVQELRSALSQKP